MRSLLSVSAALAGAASFASAQTGPARLQLQPCGASGLTAAETFTYNANKTVTQGGMCVDSDSTSLLLAQCDGSANQQWTFNSDGTVASIGQAGQCWNVLDGSTSAGSAVGIYQCGVILDDENKKTKNSGDVGLAANDVFTYISSANQVWANESRLCVSSSAPPPGPCDDFTCCNLNGLWDSVVGQCNCFAPWTGANCSSLAMLPAHPINGYGQRPNFTAWGGNAVFYEGQYHLYVAEMVNDCPLNNWGSNSRCSHAVSPTPEGPYAFSDVAVDIWCHNPQMVMFQNGSETVFALFHIGDGTGGNPKNCTPGAEEEAMDVHAEDASFIPMSALTSAASGGALHLSNSPYGPFVPASQQPPGCNNPAPMLHPNGTWYLLCDSSTLYSAPSVLGPWTQIGKVNAPGGVPGTKEDAFLFLDPRGNWHVIFHIYTTDAPEPGCVGSTVSGHVFSRDGYNWMASDGEPYTNVVEYTDGSSTVVSTRERPKLFFDAAGNPTHLFSASCLGTDFCAPTPCVNCKYLWWDAQLVQALNMLPNA